MDSVTFSEVKRICEILDELNKPENLDDPKDEDFRLNCVDQLDLLIEGPENARDMYRSGGLKILIHQMFNSKYVSVQKACLQVYSQCVQNNTLLQVASLDMGAFELFQRFI